MEKRRKPAQERSKMRVDAILNATTEVIASKGLSNLKIDDIAKAAKVSPSSIYQYFPNKQKILEELNERNEVTAIKLIKSSLENVTSLEEGLNSLYGFIDKYYLWNEEKHAITDMWYLVTADRSNHIKDLNNSQEFAGIIVDTLSPYLDDSLHEELKNVALLFAHLVGETVRLCVFLDKEEGIKIFNTFKKIMHVSISSLLMAEPT